MKTCDSCGEALGEFDRFCGNCGAPVATPIVGAEPPDRLSERESAGMATFWRKPGKWGLVSAAAAVGVVAIGAGGYYLASRSIQPGKIIRLALDDLTAAPTPEAAETEEAKPTPEASPSEADEPQETESAAPSEAATQAGGAAAPPPPDGAISPGNWTFTTVLYNVTKVDMSDTSFRLNREGIGLSETNAQCISPATAENPRASAFPFRPGMDCRPSTFTMTGGRYRSSMTCNFPQYGGRRPVEAEGQFSGSDISVNLRVRVPAQIVSGDFENPPEIYLHYRITGRRTPQPC